MGPGANKVVNELAPKIERARAASSRMGGPPGNRHRTGQAPRAISTEEATNTLTTLRFGTGGRIEAADARAAELEAEKQAMLSMIFRRGMAIDFFENTPSDSQRFGRPLMS